MTRLKMARACFFVTLFLLCNLDVILADGAVSCYRIEPGTMAGIISADLLLTLVIVIVTYHCASFRRQKMEQADKVYMNVRANRKSES
ncbi:hematopoietic cell signal transducer [Brachionichthys hirsutus]|uniref:hematopoietic cell signal transducer n=1 Tax=Brachionichthys hirsutus TaxID=412623 RepID=UPI00360510CB